MFTGIVSGIAEIKNISKKAGVVSLFLSIKDPAGLAIGDSVSINGVCLTVVELKSDGFAVEVIPETLNKSTLGSLKPKSKVNFEKALAYGEKFSGHIVAGHVDGVGSIKKKLNRNGEIEFEIECPSEILKYIVDKGSIAVDGISLTVTRITGNRLMISIIPHTLKATTLKDKKVGDKVNLEADIVGKYIEKQLVSLSGKKQITADYLQNIGFMVR